MKINLYSKPSCIWCIRLKEYLETRNINFNEFNVSKNRKASEEMIEKSGQKGVPVIEIDGQVVVGFKQEEIDKLLLNLK